VQVEAVVAVVIYLCASL